MKDHPLDPAVMDFIHANGLDTVEGAFAYRGGEDLSKPNLGHRRRTRLCVPDGEQRGAVLFMKRYGKLPFAKRLWRWVTGRRSLCEAGREFENICALCRAEVPTMLPVVWGAERDLLGVSRSYVIVTAVPGDALERVGEEFMHRCGGEGETMEQLTDGLSDVVRRLHGTGFVHRDLYASHVFLHEHKGEIELNLIDLARAFRPCCRRFRWRVKDLAQLKYSMPPLWVQRFWERFLRNYLLTEDAAVLDRWERAIAVKVDEMQCRQQRRTVRRNGKAASCESR